ncbi:hypothetical protein [Desulforegula conservatrix]|uniref:hypothetical protein n=1 Tax=Desulforegula conservatrix TaxID=153026 RepID=UPI0012EC1F5F|nr:hypothetical protein [Desulforegula conservatrix]
MTSDEIYDQDKVAVFRIAIGWKKFNSIGVAIIVIVLGFALFEILTGKWPSNNMPSSNIWLAVMVLPVGLFLIIYGLFAAFKEEKLEIYPDRIKYFGVFRIKELIWDDINGYRISETGLVLELRDPPKKKVFAGNRFERRAELIELLDKKIVNLTALEYQNELDQAINSMRFGKTEEEKKQIIGRLSIFSWAANFFCIALMFLALFRPKPYDLLIFSMVTLPVVALILLFIFRGALGLDDNNRKPIPTVDSLFLI